MRFNIEFGATVPQDQRTKDTEEIETYVSRLARVSGHPMRVVPQSGSQTANFHVLILNEEERLASADRLRSLIPDIDAASLRAFIDLPRDTLCLVIAYGRSESASYDRAVALIRGEHPELMRRACIHEELAQGLGLANDSPYARPSIFNDDEEFGLLTTHDELLLKMLYDDRFTPGMDAVTAAPIARRIATQLLEPEAPSSPPQVPSPTQLTLNEG